MHMKLTITSSFPSNIEKRCSPTTSRSQSSRLRRKLPSATTSTLNKSVPMAITSTYFANYHESTAVPTLYAYSNPSLRVNSSSNFLRSGKNSGEVSSGATASTWPPSASGQTGKQSSDMLPTKGRRGAILPNSDYSSNGHAPAMPCGLPQGY